MINALWNAGVSNAITATGLALIVFCVTIVWRNEYLARALWLLVLIKFLFPPLLAIPIARTDYLIPRSAEALPAAAQSGGSTASHNRPLAGNDLVKRRSVAEGRGAAAPGTDVKVADTRITSGLGLPAAKTIAMLLWLFGSLFCLAKLIIRTRRFDRFVRESSLASADIQNLAVAQAHVLGLRHCPDVRLIAADASPATWSAWGHPVVLLPVALTETLAVDQLQLILAHELAHIRRRDHWTRWIEVVVLVLYWWHPVARWACASLRKAEELCCDGWMLRRSGGDNTSYAEALVATVALMSRSPKTPELAITFGFRNSFNRRLQMILEKRYSSGLKMRHWLAIALVGIAVLPLSTAADDAPAPSKIGATTALGAPKDQAVQSHNVRAVAFSPDGELVAGGCADGRLCVWDAQDRGFEAAIDTHEPKIDAVQFADGGTTVLTVGQSVKTWDLTSGKLLKSVTLDRQGASGPWNAYEWNAYELSRDGSRVAGQLGGTPSQVLVWAAASGKIVRRIDAVDPALDAAFSPNGKILAVGTIALKNSKHVGSVQLFDLGSGARTRAIESKIGSISEVAFSPDSTLVAGGDHRRVRLWNVRSGELQKTFEGHSGPVESIAFSSDGKMLASGAQGPVLLSRNGSTGLSEAKLWDLETGGLIRSFAGMGHRTISIAFSPDNHYLARADYSSLTCEELAGGKSWTRTFQTTALEPVAKN